MSFYSFPNSRLCAFQFHCEHYRVRTSSKSLGSSNKVRVFSKGSLQQASTICQVEHSVSSVKGKSRSSYNSLAYSGKHLKQGHRLPNGRISGQMNRTNSKLQDNRHAACRFCSTIFCSSEDMKWYITHHGNDSSSLSMHKNHHLVNHNYLSKHKNELSEAVRDQIKSLVPSPR